MPTILIGDKRVAADNNLCFENPADWTPELFDTMLKANGLEPDPNRLKIARYLRGMNGKGSNLFALLRELDQKGISWEELVRNFPGGHRQALRFSGCKIYAGM